MAAILGYTPAASASQPARYSLQQIRETYETTRKKIDGLYAEFSLSSSEGNLGGPPLFVKVAAQGHNRLLDITHIEQPLAATSDVLRNIMYVNKDTVNVYYPLQQWCELYDLSRFPGAAWKTKYSFFFECTGWWPCADTSLPPSGARLFAVHQVLAAAGGRVRDRQELIDDAWCHVIDFGDVETLWFDMRRGTVLLRRERHSPAASEEHVLYELTDVREVTAGIWMPYRLTRITSRPRRGGKNGTPTVRQASAVIHEMRIGRLDETFFRYEPRPGDLVYDASDGRSKQVPGGWDFMDESVRLAKARNAAFSDSGGANDQRANESRNPATVLALMLIGAATGITAYLCWLRRHMVKRLLPGQNCSSREFGRPGH